MRQYLKALEDTGAFPQLPDEAGSPEPQPQAKEWVLFYLAQHHDKLGETGDLTLWPRCISQRSPVTIAMLKEMLDKSCTLINEKSTSRPACKKFTGGGVHKESS